MTRKDEIEKALNFFAPSWWGGDKGEAMSDKELTVSYEGFRKGASWADEHPQSPWISVRDDLPCNHEEIWPMTEKLIYTKKVLVALIDGTVRLLSMLYDEANDKWEWEIKNLSDEIVFWAPIPELPKK